MLLDLNVSPEKKYNKHLILIRLNYETCLDETCLGPTCTFWIDRYSVYIG
jgi:hypothetical protein